MGYTCFLSTRSLFAIVVLYSYGAFDSYSAFNASSEVIRSNM